MLPGHYRESVAEEKAERPQEFVKFLRTKSLRDYHRVRVWSKSRKDSFYLCTLRIEKKGDSPPAMRDNAQRPNNINIMSPILDRDPAEAEVMRNDNQPDHLSEGKFRYGVQSALIAIAFIEGFAGIVAGCAIDHISGEIRALIIVTSLLNALMLCVMYTVAAACNKYLDKD